MNHDSSDDWTPPVWEGIRKRQLRDENLFLAGLVFGIMVCIAVVWLYGFLRPPE